MRKIARLITISILIFSYAVSLSAVDTAAMRYLDVFFSSYDEIVLLGDVMKEMSLQKFFIK